MTIGLEGHLRQQIEYPGHFFWHRLRWHALSSYLPTDRPFELVDVGAGAGLLGAYLASEFPLAVYRYVEPIRSLRQHLIATYGTDADATESNDYQTTQFVTLLDVLEHQIDDRHFVRGILDTVRPGTTILLTVPALHRLWSQWDVALGHRRRYERDELIASLTELPLAIHEASYLFPELVPLAMFRARCSRSTLQGDQQTHRHFPLLPEVVNSALYGFGRISLLLREHWRTGTSLFVAATVSD